MNHSSNNTNHIKADNKKKCMYDRHTLTRTKLKRERNNKKTT